MTTFNEIYKTVKSLETDENTTEAKPVNPEIRCYGENIWSLESGLFSAEDVLAICDLETFATYFWESFSIADYTPSDTDEKDFLTMIYQ